MAKAIYTNDAVIVEIQDGYTAKLVESRGEVIIYQDGLRLSSGAWSGTYIIPDDYAVPATIRDRLSRDLRAAQENR